MRIKPSFIAAVASSVATTLVVGGVAVWAEDDRTTQVLHACVENVTRIMRYTTGTTCGANETIVSWNVKGSPGPAGAQGPQGVPGPKGDPGPGGSGRLPGYAVKVSGPITVPRHNVAARVELGTIDTAGCGEVQLMPQLIGSGSGFPYWLHAQIRPVLPDGTTGGWSEMAAFGAGFVPKPVPGPRAQFALWQDPATSHEMAFDGVWAYCIPR